MTHSRLATLALCLLALPLASCVSKPRYDEAVRTGQHYQRLYQDLKQFQEQLEAENRRMESELDGMVAIEEASLSGIDERMSELDVLLGRLGGEDGDVTRFEIDGGYGFSVRDSVLFDSGSAELRPDARTLIAKLAGQIADEHYERIWVRGHTDSDPIVRPQTKTKFPHGNLQLSAARAVSVAALLGGDGGLDEMRIAVAGLGMSQPVASNSDASGKGRNRRVEIVVYEGE
jgi:flagellar motor protein MotB